MNQRYKLHLLGANHAFDHVVIVVVLKVYKVLIRTNENVVTKLRLEVQS